MSLGMLLAQPRHIVAKLNGMSSGEEHEVLRSVTPARTNDLGEPCYTVAAVRIEAQSYRQQVSLGSVLQHVADLDTGVRNFQAEIGSQINVLAGKTDVLAKEHSAVARALTMLAKAYRNDPRKPYLTNKNIEELTDWCDSKVRKLSADAAFRMHMVRGTRKGNKHKKYDIGVWDLIEKRLRQESETQERSKGRSTNSSSGKS